VKKKTGNKPHESLVLAYVGESHCQQKKTHEDEIIDKPFKINLERWVWHSELVF
jgi:hypothetical protein